MSDQLPLFAFSPQDHQRMAQAIALADRARATTAENPNVGCVIYAGDRLVGRGATAPGGSPHAEVVALAQAGKQAQGAHAYVTLEPCCHTGRSGACTRALIAAGVGEVTFAVVDPNPLVAGQGAQALVAAGIAVRRGLQRDAAARSMAGFLSRLTRNRPHVTLKIAASLDARSALQNGTSQWITGAAARTAGHVLRARSDAILVGAATVQADNPRLTARLPGISRQPQRFVLDPEELITPAKGFDGWHRLATRDLGTALAEVAAMGINWLMVESGGRLAASLIQQNLVDQLWWVAAPAVLGGDSRPAIGNLALQALSDAPRYQTVETRKLGEDVLTVLEPPCLLD